MSRNAIWGTIVAALGTLLAISQVVMTAPAAFAATAATSVRPDTIKAALHIVVSPRVRIRTFVKYYTVRSGDTLSSISALVFGSPEKWPWLYDANEKLVGVDPNLIQPGDKLEEVLGTKPNYGHAHLTASVSRARAVSSVAKDKYDGKHDACGDGDGDRLDAPCSEIFPNQQAASGHTARLRNAGNVDQTVSSSNYSGYQACVVARESGGRSQVMNSSGHYGLYQFDQSTWVSGGGSASTFGHASVSEQNRVFASVYAARGTQPWSPSDGC